MTDIHPPSQHKLYKFELLGKHQELQDDLESLRISEPGQIIAILPLGEKDMRGAVRFIIKNKCFCEMTDDGVVEPGHRNLGELMLYMAGFPRPAPPPAQAVPVVKGTSTSNRETLSLAGSKTAGAVEFRILPTSHFMKKSSGTKTKGGHIIPDRYKIKPGDGSEKNN